MTQNELLTTLVENTHTLFTDEMVGKINEAFGLKWKPLHYRADPTAPKGLTIDSGKKTTTGISAYDAAILLCRDLGVNHSLKMGRGTQVRECVDRLRVAGYGEDQR
jgi:hypothetical protein